MHRQLLQEQVCRSRLNYAASLAGVPWRAVSRGLAIHLAPDGPISTHTLHGLAARGIPLRHTGEIRAQLSESDLGSADLVVALKEAEHRPVLESRFPGWPGRIRYWHVSDIDSCQPAEALREIERLVRALVGELGAGPGKH